MRIQRMAGARPTLESPGHPTPRAMITRRTFSLATLSALAAPSLSPAFAQAPYPGRPITMYVGFGAGSATDVVARVVSARLSERLHQPIAVQNTTGAASTLSTAAVARSAPDGYTLTTVSGALSIGPAVYRDLKYDIDRDLEAIGLVGSVANALLVREGLPVRSVNELVAYAKERPGKLNYGSSGVGGSTHLAAELLCDATGIRMTHIPYRGNAAAGAALLAGEIDVLIDTVLLAAQSVKTGRVRALAVTSPQRAKVLPDTPTFIEQGLPGFNPQIYFGVLGPAGMPADVVARLNRELNEVLREPEVRAQLGDTGGLQITPGTPQAFKALVHDEAVKWKLVAEKYNIRAE